MSMRNLVVLGFAEKNAKTLREGLVRLATEDLQKRLDENLGRVIALGTFENDLGLNMVAVVEIFTADAVTELPDAIPSQEEAAKPIVVSVLKKKKFADRAEVNAPVNKVAKTKGGRKT
jgi:hypothetical protein